MSRRANPTSPRTFNIRNDLWEMFAEVATELDCSMDYLLNDAMKQYARQRGIAAKQRAVSAKVSVPPRPTASTPPAPVAAAPRPTPPPPPSSRKSNRPSGFVAKQGNQLPPPPLPPGQVSSGPPPPPPPPSRLKRAAG